MGLALLAGCHPAARPGADVRTGGGWWRSAPSVPAPTGVALSLPTAGAGGFTHLRPEETGIDFANVLTPQQLAKADLLTQSGLACGDYDGDGRPDVFFCGVNVKNRLFHNKGNFRFTDVPASRGRGRGGAHHPTDGAALAVFNYRPR